MSLPKKKVSTKALPTFDELPHFKEFSGCAWDVWPENDELGTVNLLTKDVVLRAAKEEIRCVIHIRCERTCR